MKKVVLLAIGVILHICTIAQTKSIIYFDSNKSELTPASSALLDSLIHFFKDKNITKITIKGYCDNTGNPNWNQILSEQRAGVTSNYLKNGGIKTSVISVEGFSSTSPLAENTTEPGKAKNRRVEITISAITEMLITPPVTQKTVSPVIEKKSDKIIVNDSIAVKTFSSNSSVSDFKVGQTLILKNLNFEGGTDVLLPESEPTLELLLKTMKDNPTLEIEIGGHVCCKDDMPLSILRAKMLYKYLIKNGINKSRMTYVGYSRNKPIYEDDRDEERAKVNRRVEIKILKI